MIQWLNDLLFRFYRYWYARGRYWDIEPIGENHTYIRILRGRYRGTLFGYTKINPIDATFGVLTIEKRKGILLDRGYKRILSRILLVILYDLFYTPDSRMAVGIKPGEEFNDNDTEVDSKEPTEIRVLREKGSTLPDSNTIPRSH